MNEWYKIQNKSDSRAEITIYDRIGAGFFEDGVTAKSFVNDLKSVKTPIIDLHINSPGGDVFEGNTIYNALKAHKATINVKIMGVAASIASVIAMAGDSIEMPENAMMMIHDPWSFAMGSAEEMRKSAEMLDKVKVGLVSSYHNKTGIEDSEIESLMADETWFTAEEAVEFGFADKMTESVQAQASFEMLKEYKKVPSTLIKAGIRHNINNAKGDIMAEKTVPEITLDMIKADHPAIVEALSNEGKTIGLSEGAEGERKRIQAVQEQLISGHEELIENLMWDGVTTGPEAAVKVLAAEKEARKVAAADLDKDAPDPVSQPSTDIDLDDQADTPKAKWDKSKKLQNEFDGDFEAYEAYAKAQAAGKIRNSKGVE